MSPEGALKNEDGQTHVHVKMPPSSFFRNGPMDHLSYSLSMVCLFIHLAFKRVCSIVILDPQTTMQLWTGSNISHRLTMDSRASWTFILPRKTHFCIRGQLVVLVKSVYGCRDGSGPWQIWFDLILIISYVVDCC